MSSRLVLGILETMRSAFLKLAPLAILLFTGCRWQGAEGFVSATTTVNYAAEREKPDAWKGDPYAFGGVADASGGLKTQTQYGAGAPKDDTAPLNVRMAQPMKGTGQNAGEYPVHGDPSYGNSNAPVAQPTPSDVRTR
jgi:hypothetical protein